MAALAGDHVQVILDDSSGTPRSFDAGDIISVNIPLARDQFDVTGMGDDVHNFLDGQLQAPITLKGYLTTTANTGTHTVLSGLMSAGSQATLTVQVGDNTTPTNGDPEFEGEYVVESYSPVFQNGQAIQFTASLKPATGTAPAWGTVS